MVSTVKKKNQAYSTECEEFAVSLAFVMLVCHHKWVTETDMR